MDKTNYTVALLLGYNLVNLVAHMRNKTNRTEQ